VGQDSQRAEIKTFLSPKPHMKLIDLGCCLNLMFNDYDKWPSLYYGVDISPQTIDLLEKYIKKENLKVGGLDCASIHKLPYHDEKFDIATCIGVLEYFEEDFIVASIKEIYRVLNSPGRLVLDIPNIDSPVFEINQLIEDHMGRPDLFNISQTQFEHIIKDYFEVIDKQNVVGMIQYFLVKNKSEVRCHIK